MRRSNHQTFERLDEDIGIDAAFFLDHEAHVTTRRDRRDQAQCRSGLRLLGRPAFRLVCPRSGRRDDLSGYALHHQNRFGFLLLRQGLDLRVLFLQPLLDQGLVALQGAMQRPLAGNAELSQKPPPATRLKPIFDLSLIDVANISRVHSAKANFVAVDSFKSR